MKSFHNPLIDLRYWVLISLASIFGTNTGDLAVRWYKQASDVVGFPILFGLKHLGPLPILVVLFVVLYFIEKLDSKKIELYFWTAIIIIRTAATNIADSLNDDVLIPAVTTITISAILLAIGAFIWQGQRQKPIDGFFTPNSNHFYWGMMMIAGVLGTLIGDELAHAFGLQMSSLVLSVIMLGIVALGYKKFLIFTGFYWFGIAFARIAGTAVGDWLAKNVAKGGAGFGLPLATLFSGIVFITVAILLKPRDSKIAN
jgi:uncharacterized membrane-anchored protein